MAGGEPWILHLDFDAFFAAVEIQRNPRLEGKPVAVGSGVVASCSYEARAYGVRAGMPLSRARRLCPDLVILPGRGAIYRAFAAEAFRICTEYTPELVTYLDEADCDLTGTEALHSSPVAVARQLAHRIRNSLGLPVSIGLGSNRMVAKLAAKAAKPKGLGLVPHGAEETFIQDLPLEALPGIGPKALARLRTLNLTQIQDLKALSRETLEALFGLPGRALYDRCRGRDTPPVRRSEIPRTISRSTSFASPTADPQSLTDILQYLAERTAHTLRAQALKASRITAKVHYADDRTDTASVRIAEGTCLDQEVFQAARTAFHKAWTRRVALVRIVLVLCGIVPAGGFLQLSFEDDPHRGHASRSLSLMKVKDAIRSRWGYGALLSGRMLLLRTRFKEDHRGFLLRTPSLTR